MNTKTFLSDLSKLPDKNEDPVGWNQAWEQYLEEMYKPLPEYPESSLLRYPASVCLTQEFRSTQDEIQRGVCKIQRLLAVITGDKELMENFGSAWQSYSPEVRRQYLLEGLVDACSVADDIEGRRAWCPETAMCNLQRDGGRGFLNLLLTVCPSGITPDLAPSEPVLRPHPIFDAMMRIGEPCPPGENKDARLFMQRSTALLRNSFIDTFLWCMMQRICGQSAVSPPTRIVADKILVREGGEPTKPTPMDPRTVKSMEGGVMKQSIKDAQWHCVSCEKPERDLSVGEKFLVCSKCHTIGRKVAYCNRQCQLKDWKKGSPPHKSLCGKPLGLPEKPDMTPLETAPASRTDYFDASNTGPPPPDPGFIRSAALEHQISLLRYNPEASYFVVEPPPTPNHALYPQDPIGKSFFQRTRNKAMKSGDPHSVGLMYDFLLQTAIDRDFPEERIASQLSQEYGVSVDSLSGTREMMRKKRQGIWSGGTMEDLMEALGWEDS